MRTLRLASSVACIVCYAACGGRTGSDLTDYTDVEVGTGGSAATSVNMGGNSAIATATGGAPGSGATSSVDSGGSGATTSATGGKGGGGATTSATGGKSGATTSPTGGKSGATTSPTGGKGGGGATTSATGGAGGSGAKGSTGGISATTGGSSASGGTAGSGGTSSTVITTCNDSFPFLGTWEGNILDFYFDPKEALKLVLSADASGVITGKLTWGDGAPPPAPQSADIPYPPGYWDQTNLLPFMMPSPDPWPGFAYTIVRGAACDTTFRFGVSTSELWQDWCVLQTPIDSGSYGWGCTLMGGGGSSDGTTCTIYGQNGQTQTYPLWKCSACGSFGMSGVCACDLNGCFANTAATQTFNLTYSVSGSTEILSGPDPSCTDCTVRLERQN